MKENVLLLFGGKSVEHDISIITALQVGKNLPEEYDYIFCYIDRNGRWWIGKNLDDIKIYHNFQKYGKKLRQVTFVLGENVLMMKKGKKFLKYAKISAVLNCCHGNIGEDGAVQGVFKTCGVAQSSPLVLSSALCMDKAVMKDVCKANDIDTPLFVTLYRTFEKNKVLKKIKFPLIVKPANLGSSIGISVCKNVADFDKAVELAFEFDNKIIVEKMVENLREYNCACFFFDGNCFLSKVNEVTGKGEIYSFDDKYLSTESKSRTVEKKLVRRIENMTEKVYRLFDCQGIVRVDFLYDEKLEKLYVNEINTIPGSLGFYLFEGLSFKDILSAVLKQCKTNLEKENQLVKAFPSDALAIFEEVVDKVKK